MSERAPIVPPAGKFSRAAFRDWVEQQSRGRFERVDGEIVAMAPERVGHALIKANVWRALRAAIRQANVPCVALPDGVTVEIGDGTDYEPDVVVNGGEPLARDAVAAPHPVIVVEVQSRSTWRLDATDKLTDYFRVASIHHYLIVLAKKQTVVHHRRVEGGIFTRIEADGEIRLDPPGISVLVADFYEDWRQTIP